MTAFIIPVLPVKTKANRQHTCTPCRQHERIPVATAQQPGSSGGSNKWGTTNWESSNVKESSLETIEFIIRPGGMVEERVTGVKGEACAKLTEEIEDALGEVVHTEETEEYFERTYAGIGDREIVTDSDGTNSSGSTTWSGGENYSTW